MNYKKIIPLLIGLLGFATACEKGNDDNSSGNSNPTDTNLNVPEYGVPIVYYQSKSKVNSEQGIVLDEESPSNE